MLAKPGYSTSRVRTLLHRMVRCARLDGHVYRSLRDDSYANRQSLLVIMLAGLCFGIGFAVSIGSDYLGLLIGALAGAAASVGIGFTWLSLTFLVGTRLLRGSSTYWELARPLFFSASPGIVFLGMLIQVSIIPEIARAIGLSWIAIASVTAIKNGLGFDSQRSFTTFIIAAFIMIILFALIYPLIISV